MKYGIFLNLLAGLNVENVLELFGGVGIQTYYLENHKKINRHTVVERDKACFDILKSMFPSKEIILSDNRDLQYDEKYDLVVLDSGMNKSNFDETIQLMKKTNSKYFIITETGAFSVRFNKNLSYEEHYQNTIQKLNSVGYKVEKVLYELNYGLILINNEFAGRPTINKNIYVNKEWRRYIKKII